MPKLWRMGSSIKAMERLRQLEDRTPPAFEWIDRFEQADAVESLEQAMGGEQPCSGQLSGVDRSSLPKPRFRCTDAEFAPEFIFEGDYFASARLVETLALDPATVQLLDVDCSACPPAMQAKEYRLLNLLCVLNPMDRERSRPNDFIRFTRTDGSVDYVWDYLGAGPNGPAPHIVWQEDIVLPASLFHVPASSWTLATEDLAARVTRAGFDEVVFYDYTRRDRLVKYPEGATLEHRD